MQKELSNLIQVQIQQQFQQQMQLQQQIHLPLEKGTPQMMHNWLSVANPSLTNQQMQTLVNQKVPPNIKSVAPNHNSMVKSQRLSNIFLVNIQGINPKVKKQKVKFALLKENVLYSDKITPFFVLTETHLKIQYLMQKLAYQTTIY